MSNNKVISLQIGKVSSYGNKNSKEFLDKYWESASFKEAVTGNVWAGRLGLVGDEVADKVHHGGLDKAIFANSYENYPTWAKFLKLSHIPFGALAENLTISTLHESSVHIGDIHQIGTALLQVSQPRKPCWKISRRWENKEFTKEIFTTGLSGWYYRVLEEGNISSGDEVKIISQNPQRVTILNANIAFANPNQYKEILKQILSIENLALSYEASILKRLQGDTNLDYMNT